jgi:hypothetical protein
MWGKAVTPLLSGEHFSVDGTRIEGLDLHEELQAKPEVDGAPSPRRAGQARESAGEGATQKWIFMARSARTKPYRLRKPSGKWPGQHNANCVSTRSAASRMTGRLARSTKRATLWPSP